MGVIVRAAEVGVFMEGFLQGRKRVHRELGMGDVAIKIGSTKEVRSNHALRLSRQSFVGIATG